MKWDHLAGLLTELNCHNLIPTTIPDTDLSAVAICSFRIGPILKLDYPYSNVSEYPGLLTLIAILNFENLQNDREKILITKCTNFFTHVNL